MSLPFWIQLTLLTGSQDTFFPGENGDWNLGGPTHGWKLFLIRTHPYNGPPNSNSSMLEHISKCRNDTCRFISHRKRLGSACQSVLNHHPRFRSSLAQCGVVIAYLSNLTFVSFIHRYWVLWLSVHFVVTNESVLWTWMRPIFCTKMRSYGSCVTMPLAAVH